MKPTTLIVAIIITIGLSQTGSAFDATKSVPAASQPAAASSAVKHENSAVRKIELEIDADRDKIIEESKAINIDKRKLKEAEKGQDKGSAEQIKNDIEERDARIKDLKKEVAGKKEQRYFLMNGKQKDEARRSHKDLK